MNSKVNIKAIGLSVTAICLAIFCPTDFVYGCKWCPPDLGPSLLRQLDTADAAVLAELVQRADPKAEKPTSKYRVVKVLKGSLSKPGDKFTVPLNVQSAECSVHLFINVGPAKAWNNPLGLSADAREFLEQVAQLPSGDQNGEFNNRLERLRFTLPYLGSSDGQIALAAHHEFSSAPFSVLEELRLQLNHRQIVSWIQAETTLAANRRHLFALLSICGNKYDYVVVSEALEERLKNGKTADLDMIVFTLLALGGKKALDKVQSQLLGSSASFSIKRATVDALRYHAEQDTLVQKQQVIQIYRQLLKDPKTADYVLEDLARWKDWESLEQVLELWKIREDHRWLKYPVLDYLRACPMPQARQLVKTESASGKR